MCGIFTLRARYTPSFLDVVPFYRKARNLRTSGGPSFSQPASTNLSTLSKCLCRSLRFLSSIKMFGKRSFASSKDRSGKIQKQSKRSFRDAAELKQKQKKMVEKLDARKDSPMMEATSPSLTSAIVTVVVGPDQRLFAAHEDVLSHAPFFAQALLDNPSNPLSSPYAPSFLAANRCASVLVKSFIHHYERCPDLCGRFWGIWTHAFSAAVSCG